MVLSVVIIGGGGGGPVVTIIELEAPDVPQVVVHVAVYVPAPTSLVVPVPPPNQLIVPVSQPVAVNIAFSVPQISVLLAVILGGVVLHQLLSLPYSSYSMFHKWLYMLRYMFLLLLLW